ncbi:response regulator [bacterium]|nr:response regulator [bacterium]
MRTRSTLIVSAAAAVLFWVLDALIDAFVFGEAEFLESLVQPNGYELYMRISILAALLLASVLAFSHSRRMAQAQDNILAGQRALEVRNRIAEIFLTGRLPQAYGTVLSLLCTESGCRRGLLGIVGPRGELEIVAVHPPSRRRDPDFFPPPCLPLAGLPHPWPDILLARAPRVIPGLTGLPAIDWSADGILAAPIRGSQDNLGLLVLGDRDRDFEEIDLEQVGALTTFLAPILQSLAQAAEREQQAIQAQKMEALGALAGGISHDFNNILQAIMGFAAMAREAVEPGSTPAQDLDRVLRAAQRGRDLVKRIEMVSFPAEESFRTLPLQDAITEAVGLLEHTAPANISILTDLDPDCGPILAHPPQIQQVLLNLGTNAIHAMEGDNGELTITLNRVSGDESVPWLPEDLAGHDLAVVRMTDTGGGMDGDTLQRAFDPFYTTKSVGKGTGLGLSVVHSIIKNHGGRILVESNPGKGTVIRICFPVCDPGPADRALEDGNGEDLKGRLMFVDDEEDITLFAKAFLEARGHLVAAFTDPETALEEFASRPGEYDLVISDLVMPRLTGDRLAARIREIRKDVPVILISGYAENEYDLRSANPAVAGLIRKPFTSQILARAVARALRDTTFSGEV